jgi:hypothetical protein
MCRNFKKTKSIGMFCHFEGGGEGGLFKGILHDYQMFAEIFYRRYPCVGTSPRTNHMGMYCHFKGGACLRVSTEF